MEGLIRLQSFLHPAGAHDACLGVIERHLDAGRLLQTDLYRRVVGRLTDAPLPGARPGPR